MSRLIDILPQRNNYGRSPAKLVGRAILEALVGCASPDKQQRSEFTATSSRRTRAQPAQHESFATSLLKASAASFRPSTVVRYGKIVSARSSTVRPCRIASAADWMLS